MIIRLAAVAVSLIVLGVLALAIDWILPRITGGAHGGRWIDPGLRKRHAKKIGCADGYFHDRDKRHWACATCKQKTCHRAMRINPKTLKRSTPPTCYKCGIRYDPLDEADRARRREKDWRLLTDPIDGSALSSSMPEQYKGATRAAIRAFLASDNPVSAVDGIDAGTLNASIASLGLRDDVYAETRAGQTILRRSS